MWLQVREYPERPLVGVGVILVKDRQILLVKRGHEPNKGMWSIPGGLIKLGETAEEAAIREVREETGLEVSIGAVAGVFNVIIKDSDSKIKYHYVIIDYFGEVVGGMLRPGTDVTDARWFWLDEIGDVETSPTVRKALELFRKNPAI
ncbi:MAG: NUDIX hydrolase [Candidatus Methanomethylicota archaeon]|uniref:NUDIX hydrolase n=1 Tax=Thermoproteota archaeon TaxID=2056631 RepID=A0A523BGK8_9CREN|nr:MAG: NUDIX hydrolase [Candidatus Verstraetearchaeota archaeon]